MSCMPRMPCSIMNPLKDKVTPDSEIEIEHRKTFNVINALKITLTQQHMNKLNIKHTM